jgi:hypothetical protein
MAGSSQAREGNSTRPPAGCAWVALLGGERGVPARNSSATNELKAVSINWTYNVLQMFTLCVNATQRLFRFRPSSSVARSPYSPHTSR